MDIFEREKVGETISLDDPEYGKIAELIAEAQQVIAEPEQRMDWRWRIGHARCDDR